MSWLPKGTTLGRLDIDEVFIDYDGPRLFSCVSTTGQSYLAGWAEEALDHDLWLYVPVSRHRLTAIKTGSLTLLDAYLHAEGLVYVVRLDSDEEVQDRLELYSPDQLEDNWLPDPNFRLNIEVQTHPAAVSIFDLQRRAAGEGRTRIRIEISDRSVMRTESATRRVASTLNAAQNVLDNFGLVELDVEPAQDGRFTKLVQARMDTNVVELAAASFVIELGSRDTEDLLGDSPIARVSERLIGLFSPQLGTDELWSELADLKPRAAKSFRSFVNVLASYGSDIALAAASSSRGAVEHRLSADQVSNLRVILQAIVPDEIRTIRGRMMLFSGDNERRTFGLRDPFDGTAYEGRVGERAVAAVEHAVLGNLYDVVISEYAQLDKGVGELRVRHVLDQLLPAADDSIVATIVSTDQEGSMFLFASPD